MTERSALEQELYARIEQKTRSDFNDLFVKLSQATIWCQYITIRGIEHDPTGVISGVEEAIVKIFTERAYKEKVNKLVETIANE